MIKESRNIDFSTTGRQPSEQDFARISEWIQKDKQKHHDRSAEERKNRKLPGGSKNNRNG